MDAPPMAVPPIATTPSTTDVRPIVIRSAKFVIKNFAPLLARDNASVRHSGSCSSWI